MHLSVIIPVYNESKRIDGTLNEVINFLKQKNYTYEIIIVNDGSTDNSLQIIEKFSNQNPQIKIINIPKNIGKGNAVKQGMLQAVGQYRLFMDADNSTPINELDILLPYSEEGIDVVIGSRKVPGSEIVAKRNMTRDLLSKIFSFFTALAFPIMVKDPQNGFKIFSKKSAEIIFKKQTIKRWAFDVEILLIARKNNLTIKEVPIHWTNSNFSKMNLKGMTAMLIDTIKIQSNLLKGLYNTDN